MSASWSYCASFLHWIAVGATLAMVQRFNAPGSMHLHWLHNIAKKGTPYFPWWSLPRDGVEGWMNGRFPNLIFHHGKIGLIPDLLNWWTFIFWVHIYYLFVGWIQQVKGRPPDKLSLVKSFLRMEWLKNVSWLTFNSVTGLRGRSNHDDSCWISLVQKISEETEKVSCWFNSLSGKLLVTWHKYPSLWNNHVSFKFIEYSTQEISRMKMTITPTTQAGFQPDVFIIHFGHCALMSRAGRARCQAMWTPQWECFLKRRWSNHPKTLEYPSSGGFLPNSDSPGLIIARGFFLDCLSAIPEVRCGKARAITEVE